MHNFGAGDVIEIARPDGDTVLLAFTRETVPIIDIAGGRIIVCAVSPRTTKMIPTMSSNERRSEPDWTMLDWSLTVCFPKCFRVRWVIRCWVRR